MFMLSDKCVEGYLMECLGYDELMVKELKDNWKPLKDCLNEEEKQDCINYWL